MTIPFVKCQAVGNDFLIVQRADLETCGLREEDIPSLARRICDRHLGIGADGVEIVEAGMHGADASLRLFNSDGSEAEISGNGTRCVAAWLTWKNGGSGPLNLHTHAGTKQLWLLDRTGSRYSFGMNMGQPLWRDGDAECKIETSIGSRAATIVNVGNPQCVFFVDSFDFDWRALGREVELLPRFPARTNVSFVKVIDKGAIDVRFWERGAGETLSSGTGSTGAGAAAILTGRCESPLRILTPAGEMKLRWEGDAILEGDAEIVGAGKYFQQQD